LTDNELEKRKQELLAGYARGLRRLELICVAIALIGLLVGIFFVNDALKPYVIVIAGGSGLLAANLFRAITKRILAGPKT
jgi:hypothetical protein